MAAACRVEPTSDFFRQGGQLRSVTKPRVPAPKSDSNGTTPMTTAAPWTVWKRICDDLDALLREVGLKIAA